MDKLVVGVITFFAASLLIASLVGQRMADDDAKRSYAEAKMAGGARVVLASDIFIGPGLDPDPDVARCMIEAGAKPPRNLIWEGAAKGWRSPKLHPEPRVFEDAAVYRGRVEVWEQAMRGYVTIVAADWVDCRKSSEPPPVARAQPSPTIPGAYKFDFQVADARCKFPPPTLQIAISYQATAKPPFKLTINLPQGQLVLPGELQEPDYTFRARFEDKSQAQLLPGAKASGINAYLELRGRFDVFDNRTIIREGVGESSFKLDGEGGTCRFSYGATRLDG